jgi:hypothetical protein
MAPLQRRQTVLSAPSPGSLTWALSTSAANPASGWEYLPQPVALGRGYQARVWPGARFRSRRLETRPAPLV